MLRKLLDYQLALAQKGKPLEKLYPLISAADTFLYEAPNTTKMAPHIRDSVDVKRWMWIVILSLIPCIIMAIWNTGLQSFVYSSGDYKLMNEYLAASHSFNDYFAFVGKDNRYLTILKLGSLAFFPVMFISYAVGGLWEALFAVVRRHEVAEGFLVTGMLYPLILPPTIPYWMVAVGVSVGVIFAKEIFGGTGMNIMNPALACRTFLYFAYPGKMTGDVWAGTNPTVVRESLIKMNQEAHTSTLDGYTQATPLARFNVSQDIKRIHIDAIATNDFGNNVDTIGTIEKHFNQWNEIGHHQASLGQLTQEQMRQFVTTPLPEGGLGLSSGNYEDAYNLSSLNYGLGNNSDGSFLFGNRIGSMGETSIVACLLGALFLIYTGVGSWRTMVAVGLGAFLTASFFEFGSKFFSHDSGAWNPAQYSFPAYKHMILGGLAFGLVFMATDPVSSPSMNSAKWIYGLIVGMISIVIRIINPAYPEGVMMAIITGNVLAPLLDYYAARNFRRMRRVRI
jgi:Na+-transporting NADH:ubiquinone oxidoreductase subunit B